MMNHSTSFRSVLTGLMMLLLAGALFAGDLAGTWTVTFDTEGGERSNEIAFKLEGENVTAKMGDNELKGTFKGGELVLAGEFYSDEAGYKAEFEMNGKMDGDKLKGNCSWDVYEMTFTAVKK